MIQIYIEKNHKKKKLTKVNDIETAIKVACENALETGVVKEIYYTRVIGDINTKCWIDVGSHSTFYHFEVVE